MMTKEQLEQTYPHRCKSCDGIGEYRHIDESPCGFFNFWVYSRECEDCLEQDLNPLNVNEAFDTENVDYEPPFEIVKLLVSKYDWEAYGENKLC